MKLQHEQLNSQIDKLHKKYGDKNLCMLYGTGCTKNADVMLVFMNPTARNISTQKSWKGVRASWIGHKNTWKLLADIGLFDRKLSDSIQTMKPIDWTPEFANKIYTDIAKRKVFITGLGRCVQPDARPLPNSVFQESLPVMLEEIKLVNPKIIIAFGNQVASNLLQVSVKVSEARCKKYELKIDKKTYPTFATYYPVGMGLRNIGKTIEDIKNILKKYE